MTQRRPDASGSGSANLDWLLGPADDQGSEAVRHDWPANGVPGDSRRPRRGGIGAGHSPFPQADGAPAVSMPGLAGRFAAEWCPTGTSSGRNALRRERGRTGGGVMVRRAILDRDDQLAADDEALPLSQLSVPRSAEVADQWRGAGGRWLVWVARAIAWAVLILIGYRGVLAIVEGQGSPAAAVANQGGDNSQFPVTLAEAYAMQFGQVYLSFSPATAAQRAQSLARFLPPGSDPQLGWNGAGTQHMMSEQVAAVSVTGAHTAVVTLLARLASGRLFELGVPIYAAHGGMSVSGEPALLPGPRKVAPPTTGQVTADQATETALRSQLPAFFQAYASGDRTTLTRFTTPGARVTGLGGAVRFGGIANVYVPAGGARRQISVTVTWDLVPAGSPASGTVAAAPAALQMVYQMTVIRQAGTWDVQSIGASTHVLGPP